MWYVVADPVVSTVEDDPAIWTLSKSPTKPGWETFGGYPGYGLTKADAEFLARCANEKLAEMLPKSALDAFRQDKG